MFTEKKEIIKYVEKFQIKIVKFIFLFLQVSIQHNFEKKKLCVKSLNRNIRIS